MTDKPKGGFKQGAKEQKNAKPTKADRGRERQNTGDTKKKVK